MYVNNTNILLLIYNVYNYDYSFGEKNNKRTLIVKLKETRNFSKYIVLCAKEIKLNIYTNTTSSYIKSFLNSEGFSILNSCIHFCMLGFLR